MDNGGTTSCAVCGSALAAGASTCAACGASTGHSASALASPGSEPGAGLRITGESAMPAVSFARPDAPAAPLPTRTPGKVGGDAPWESFAKSWESSSSSGESSHSAFLPAEANGDGAGRAALDDFFRATTSVRTAQAAARDGDSAPEPSVAPDDVLGSSDASGISEPALGADEPDAAGGWDQPASPPEPDRFDLPAAPPPIPLASLTDLAPAPVPVPVPDPEPPAPPVTDHLDPDLLEPVELPPLPEPVAAPYAVPVPMPAPEPVAIPEPVAEPYAPEPVAEPYAPEPVAEPYAPEPIAAATEPEAAEPEVTPVPAWLAEPLQALRTEVPVFTSGLAIDEAEPAEPPAPVEPPPAPEPSKPPEPPEPADPPTPDEPPRPVEPPKPPKPEPSRPPAPGPVPTPFPPTPPPPRPVPQPIPPLPPPPSPPPSPVPPTPPPLPPPSPNPPAPGPVPPPPTIGPPIATPSPGLYRGGVYGRAEGRATAVAPVSVPVPRQRPGGTVYGGVSGRPTSANYDAPLEQSGSLTGHILSAGRPALVPRRERRSRLKKVLFVGLGAIVFVTAIALTVSVLAGDFLRALFKTLLGG
jgi:hypothetical protein